MYLCSKRCQLLHYSTADALRPTRHKRCLVLSGGMIKFSVNY